MTKSIKKLIDPLTTNNVIYRDFLFYSPILFAILHHKYVIYAFVKSSLLRERIKMFYSINLMSVFQNARINLP